MLIVTLHAARQLPAWLIFDVEQKSMQSTIYLIRHAQSMPRLSQPQSRWRLSPVGLAQADQLARLLAPLEIQRAFSSPFTRSLETAAPFAKLACLEIGVLDALRERNFDVVAHDSDQHWLRSWDDFAFASPQGESSAEAQSRFVDAVRLMAEKGGTCAVFAHGHVIALFLNSIDASIGRKEAEAFMNPDVLRVTCREGVFFWERDFRLQGLSDIATHHSQTPKEKPNKAPEPTPGSVTPRAAEGVSK